MTRVAGLGANRPSPLAAVFLSELESFLNVSLNRVTKISGDKNKINNNKNKNNKK